MSIMENCYTPGSHVLDQLILANFVEDHQVSISAKLFWILVSIFWVDILKVSLATISHTPGCHVFGPVRVSLTIFAGHIPVHFF